MQQRDQRLIRGVCQNGGARAYLDFTSERTAMSELLILWDRDSEMQQETDRLPFTHSANFSRTVRSPLHWSNGALV